MPGGPGGPRGMEQKQATDDCRERAPLLEEGEKRARAINRLDRSGAPCEHSGGSRGWVECAGAVLRETRRRYTPLRPTEGPHKTGRAGIVERIVRVANIPGRCGCRHELHESHRAGFGSGAWVKVGFGFDHGTYESRIKSLLLGVSSDHLFQLFP